MKGRWKGGRVPTRQSTRQGADSPNGRGTHLAETYLALKEAAEVARCSEKTVRRAIKTGKVVFREEETPAGKRYLVELASLRHFAEELDRMPGQAKRRLDGQGSGGQGGQKVEGPVSGRVDSPPSPTGPDDLAWLRVQYERLVQENKELRDQLVEVKPYEGEARAYKSVQEQFQRLLKEGQGKVLELAAENERIRVENEQLRQQAQRVTVNAVPAHEVDSPPNLSTVPVQPTPVAQRPRPSLITWTLAGVFTLVVLLGGVAMAVESGLLRWSQ